MRPIPVGGCQKKKLRDEIFVGSMLILGVNGIKGKQKLFGEKSEGKQMMIFFWHP
jgi:hypothetical protein